MRDDSWSMFTFVLNAHHKFLSTVEELWTKKS